MLTHSISKVAGLALTTACLAINTQADPLARQQDLSRHLQEHQFDLKMQQMQELPPPVLRQRKQEKSQQDWLQQEKAIWDLYEQQRRQLLQQEPPSDQQLQRAREAQALDFKLSHP